MPRLTITLRKADLAFAEEQRAAGGFRSVRAYIGALVGAERKRHVEAQLLGMVREAEASGPATPMTERDWDNIRGRVAQRAAKGRKEPGHRGGRTPKGRR